MPLLSLGWPSQPDNSRPPCSIVTGISGHLVIESVGLYTDIYGKCAHHVQSPSVAEFARR